MTARVAFADFSADLLSSVRVLRDAIGAAGGEIRDDMRDANVLVFGDYGGSHRSFDGTKVHYTAENYRPRWTNTDFSIGYDYVDDSRYLRLPLPVVFAYADVVDGFAAPPRKDWAERSFCNFVYFRPGTRMRRALFNELAGYRPVTSPGRFLNNASAPGIHDPSVHWRHSKIPYQAGFRFTIAAENGAFPGYTSEKLYDALIAGTIPIYWGDPRVADDVDERAFINVSSYATLKDVVDAVAEIDRHPELAQPYLDARPFMRTGVDEWFARTVDTFTRVFEHAELHRSDPAQAARARRLTADAGRVLRVATTMRAIPRTISSLDKRWLGGRLHRAYDRVPGARRIARAIRGPGF